MRRFLVRIALLLLACDVTHCRTNAVQSDSAENGRALPSSAAAWLPAAAILAPGVTVSALAAGVAAAAAILTHETLLLGKTRAEVIIGRLFTAHALCQTGETVLAHFASLDRPKARTATPLITGTSPPEPCSSRLQPKLPQPLSKRRSSLHVLPAPALMWSTRSPRRWLLSLSQRLTRADGSSMISYTSPPPPMRAFRLGGDPQPTHVVSPLDSTDSLLPKTKLAHISHHISIGLGARQCVPAVTNGEPARSPRRSEEAGRILAMEDE